VFQNGTWLADNRCFSLKKAVFAYGMAFALIEAKQIFHLTKR
jgi:hypothetical protein